MIIFILLLFTSLVSVNCLRPSAIHTIEQSTQREVNVFWFSTSAPTRCFANISYFAMLIDIIESHKKTIGRSCTFCTFTFVHNLFSFIQFICRTYCYGQRLLCADNPIFSHPFGRKVIV